MTVEGWFAGRGWRPFAFQREVWEAYAAGDSGLVHAETGTGKTYAVWFAALAEALGESPPERPARRGGGAPPALRRGGGAPLSFRRGGGAPSLRVLWITPLRALAADTAAALSAPLADLGLRWSLGLRTGDTSAAVRSRGRRSACPTHW